MNARSGAALAALAFALSAVVASATAFAAAPPQAEQIKLPEYQREVLPNGLVLLTLEQHEVPLFSAQVALRAGAAADPVGQEGTADITASLLRRGSQRRSGDELAAALDFLGADLGGGAGQESSQLEVELLAKDADQGLAILAEVLLQPSFPDEELQKMLTRARDAVRRAKDEPSHVLGSYLARFFYGADHPYGRPAGGDEESLQRIGRQQVLDFYAAHYQPQVAVLVLAGDLPRKRMRELALKHFGGWKKGSAVPAVVPPTPAARPGRVLLVDKPDAPQTHYAFVARGVARSNPDRTGIKVLNTLFGGRFGSWLNRKLRIEEGLTYGARSGFAMPSQPGHFSMSSFTETPNTEKALTLTLEQLDRLHAEGPTEEELASVRTYIKGQFAPGLETADQIAGVLLSLELYGLDRDEVDGFFGRVDRIDRKEAQRLIQAFFPQRADLDLVLIGKADALRPIAAKFGTVEEKSISAVGF